VGGLERESVGGWVERKEGKKQVKASEVLYKGVSESIHTCVCVTYI